MRLAQSIIVSSSPFLVSLPFTIFDVNRFETDQPRALWQPPSFVFGIVWPILYTLLFTMNFTILRNPLISKNIKNVVVRDTIIESFLQGFWLYSFRFQKDVKKRIQSYGKSLLFMISLVIFSLYRCYYFLKTPEILPYIGFYLPYVLWINFAHILNWQLTLGYTK
tara:strand:- start:1606 stop:2100 length:495 start_codon:yes stop_codon:yes gene_type:complete